MLLVGYVQVISLIFLFSLALLWAIWRFGQLLLSYFLVLVVRFDYLLLSYVSIFFFVFREVLLLAANQVGPWVLCSPLVTSRDLILVFLGYYFHFFLVYKGNDDQLKYLMVVVNYFCNHKCVWILPMVATHIVFRCNYLGSIRTHPLVWIWCSWLFIGAPTWQFCTLTFHYVQLSSNYGYSQGQLSLFFENNCNASLAQLIHPKHLTEFSKPNYKKHFLFKQLFFHTVADTPLKGRMCGSIRVNGAMDVVH